MLTSVNRLWEILSKEKFITTDKYLAHCRKKDIAYAKRDFLLTPGRWRGEFAFPPLSVLLFGKKLVVGHSDIVLDDPPLNHFLRINPRLRIFATNSVSVANRVFQIPLGLTNHTRESSLHEIFGDNSLLLDAFQEARHPTNYEHSIYLSMTLTNNTSARSALVETLRSYTPCRIETPTFSKRGRRNYLVSLSNHSLIPCPVGNGPDTHRIWETLYMGGVPVILKSKYLSPLLADLPVIQIDNWNELMDPKSMEQQWHKAKNCQDLSALDIDYWLYRIQSECN